MCFSADSKLVHPAHLQKKNFYPYLIPLPPTPTSYPYVPRFFFLIWQWAGEPIWNPQKNTQVGTPTPTSYPYLAFLFYLAKGR